LETGNSRSGFVTGMSLTSYNGWPASKDQAEINVKPFAIKGTAIKIRCAKDAGPLLAAFAAEFHALIEPIDEGKLDDWAYAFRYYLPDI